MLRTTIDRAYQKRTIRELYGYSQSTPKDCLLDPAWARATDIYPGMGMVSFSSAASGISDLVTIPDAAGDIPYGLCGLFIAPAFGIDEIRDAGVNSCPVWVLSPGSEFEILAPAFDNLQTWTFPTNGTELLVYVQTAANASPLRIPGQLVPAGATGTPTTKPIARAISRPASDRLIISGLNAGAAY